MRTLAAAAVCLLAWFVPSASAGDPPATPKPKATASKPAPNPFPRRARALKRGSDGKLRPDQAAVTEALKWLAAHQAPDGAWKAEHFGRWCDGTIQKSEDVAKEGRGQAIYDVGLTGLALQAFLAAGYTPRGKHGHARVVAKGLGYLIKHQDQSGCFGKRRALQWIYNHAMATLAVVEAAGMTGSKVFLGSAQRALDFAAARRNTNLVWHYGPRARQANNTHLSSCLFLAFRAASFVNEAAVKAKQTAPLKVDASVYGGMTRWLERMTDPDYGLVGYTVRGSGSARPQHLIHTFPQDRSRSLTAAGVFVRHLLGDGTKHRHLHALSLRAMFFQPPQWKRGGFIDFMYWYWGSLATWQAGGKSWPRWKKALHAAVLPNQRVKGTYCRYRGSWDPRDPWSAEGGRVYATAILCLSLLAETRYERVPGH